MKKILYLIMFILFISCAFAVEDVMSQYLVGNDASNFVGYFEGNEYGRGMCFNASSANKVDHLYLRIKPGQGTMPAVSMELWPSEFEGASTEPQDGVGALTGYKVMIPGADFIINSPIVLNWTNASRSALTINVSYCWIFNVVTGSGTNYVEIEADASPYVSNTPIYLTVNTADFGASWQTIAAKYYYNITYDEEAVVPPVVNLTDHTGAGTNTTSDTTPTVNATTDKNAICNISIDNSTWFSCSTTGTTVHQCTVSATDPLTVGYPQNVTVNCTDPSFNSGYATIQYNITNPGPTFENVKFTPINSSGDIMGNSSAFNTGNMSEIETMNITFGVTDVQNISNIKLYFTANGTSGCSLGNQQHMNCYNSPDGSWVEFLEGVNTTSYDGTTTGGNVGDRIHCSYAENSSGYRNYSCSVDEHYNPNVFKHYPFNFSDVKWQTGTAQRITKNQIIMFHSDHPDIIPIDANFYKLDFRVNCSVLQPLQPLEAFACNSEYSSTYIGSPHDAPDDVCALVAQKTCDEFQDDGTKFRGIFTNDLLTNITNITWVVLDTVSTSASRYYYIKTYKSPTNAQHWNYSTDEGQTWSQVGDGYETEYNLNWFYNESVISNVTQFVLKVWSNDTLGAELNSSIEFMQWDIAEINFPPLVSIISPSDGTSFQNGSIIAYEWLASDPNNDSFVQNITIFNSSDIINIATQLPKGTDTFDYTLNVSVGEYNTTVEVCENETADLFCRSSTHTIEVTNTVVNLFLDDVNASRSYEYQSFVNISSEVNIIGTSDICLTCDVCIDLDAPGYGIDYVCGNGSASFIYNITKLRQSNFSDGSSSVNLVIADLYIENKTNIDSENLTFDLPRSEYINLTFNSNSTVINSTLYITGLTNKCYQETANISTTCGGLNTGLYHCTSDWDVSLPCENTYDTNWDIYGASSGPGTDGYIEINYTKNTTMKNATWEVKDGQERVNLTIPQECFNAYPTDLSLRAISFGLSNVVVWYCHNTTDYVTLRTGTVNKRIYEEAIFWDIYPKAITIDIENNETYSNTSEFNGTSRIDLNVTTLQNCVDTCNKPSGTRCLCELNFSSSTVGTIQIDSGSESYSEKFDSTLNQSQVNFTMDSRTDIESVSINITSTGLTSDVVVNEKVVRGNLIDNYLEDNEFSYRSTYYEIFNLSYIEEGTKNIFVNLSSNPNNLSFKIWGFGIDIGNDLNYHEFFNETNDTLTDIQLTDAVGAQPMGEYDNFETNITSRWTETNNGIETLKQTNDQTNNYYFLRDNIVGSGINHDGHVINDGDSNFNFSNYERVDFDISSEVVGSGGQAGGVSDGVSIIMLTDGNNEIEIRRMAKTFSDCSKIGSEKLENNVSFRRQDEDHYYVFVDEVLTDTVDVSILSNSLPWYIKLKLIAQTSQIKECQILAEFKIYNILGSGWWLNKTSEGTEFDTFGTMRSDVIANTTVDNNYTAVTVNAKALLNENMTYEISATNGTRGWEDITSFVNIQKYVFSTQGNQLAWRVNGTGTNESSPIVYDFNINVFSTNAENVTIDFGGDGSKEFVLIGKLNATTSPQNVTINQSNLHKYNQSFTEIEISTDIAGQIQVDNMVINSSANPVVLDNEDFEDCNNCEIKFSFTGDNMTVSDLRADFFGSWNYTATGHSPGYVTIASHIIQIFYSKLNVSMPYNIKWYDVFPSSNTQNNVTPYGQTPTVPIWNVSSQAYDEGFDVYVRTNSTMNSCLNVTYTNVSGYDFGINYTITLNETYKKVLHNLTPSSHNGLWNYWNLNSCSNRFEIPWVYFSAICTDCVFNDDYLDGFNIIAE